MKQVTIYTDGACSGNPGPGGWGAILQYGPHTKEMSGGEANTTNNRMELTGVIRALQTLKEPCAVDLYSDSKYVIDALEKGWAKGWRARGWVKRQKARPEPGSVGRPSGPVRGPPGPHPLGQGPRGKSIQQPLRPVGRQRVAEAEIRRRRF